MAEPHSYRPPLDVGSVGLRASGYWGVVFIALSEASLFCYLLFSYFYFAVQPHGGPWPPGGPPTFLYAAPQTALMLIGCATSWWAHRGARLGVMGTALIGLGLSLLCSVIFIALQFADWYDKPFALATDPYSSLYFTITGLHLAHIVLGTLIFAVVIVWTALGYFGAFRHTPIAVAVFYWYFLAAVWLAIFFTLNITPYLE